MVGSVVAREMLKILDRKQAYKDSRQGGLQFLFLSLLQNALLCLKTT